MSSEHDPRRQRLVANQLDAGVSVVVPVYGGGTAICALVERTSVVLNSLGARYELVLVDDASPSPTCDIALQMAQDNEKVTLLRFSRNFGQHAALLAGVRAAKFDIVVTLDDDLQNPPEDVPLLLARLKLGDADVVYGYTPRTSHSFIRRCGSIVLRWFFGWATGSDAIRHAGPFRAFRTNLRDGFSGAVGPGVSLNALLGWSTQRFGYVEVRHDKRVDGASGYTLRKLSRFAFDTLTEHSVVMLSFVTALGLWSVGLGLGILTWVFGRYLFGGASIAGFPFLASSIALFSGAQMLSLGIIGQYLGRIHLRVQGRPSYHIAERVSSGIERHGPEGDK